MYRASDRRDPVTQAARVLKYTYKRWQASGGHCAYIGAGEAVVITRWGGRLYLPCDDRSLAPELMINGEYEPWLAAFMRRVLRPGDAFVDVGANIGTFSVLAGRLVREAGLVVAYEAEPRNVRYLERNVAANYLDAWTIIRAVAAWSQAGTVELRTSARGADYRGDISVSDDVTMSSAVLPAVALHADLPNMHIRMVKIDVEGGEPQVLHGLMPRLLRPDVDVLVLEYLPELLGRQGQAKLVELLRTLRDRGARFRLPAGGPGLTRPARLDEVAATATPHLVVRLPQR